MSNLIPKLLILIIILIIVTPLIYYNFSKKDCITIESFNYVERQETIGLYKELLPSGELSNETYIRENNTFLISNIS